MQYIFVNVKTKIFIMNQFIFNTLSGTKFNSVHNHLYGNSEQYKLVKLTNEIEVHNGYKFKNGLNIDTNHFHPFGSCQSGGIYFIFAKNMDNWISYNNKNMVYYRFVIIPDDAQVYIENGKFKTNKLILSEKKNLLDYNFSLIENNVKLLKYYKQTVKICLKAVKRNGLALKYVNNQTREICLKAVWNNWCALKYVKNQTDEICFEAIARNGCAIIYIKNRTCKMYFAIILQICLLIFFCFLIPILFLFGKNL